MLKKILIGIICVLVLLLVGIPYMKNKEVNNATTSDVDFDLISESTSNYKICGLWDSENKDQYRYVIIKPRYVMDVYGVAEITEIGEEAFKNYDKIETIHIPSSITTIQKNAFLGCKSLKKVTFSGNEEQWKKIKVESGNEILGKIIVEYEIPTPDYD